MENLLNHAQFVCDVNITQVKNWTRGSKHAITHFDSPRVDGELYIFSRPKAGGRGYLTVERAMESNEPFGNWTNSEVIATEVHTAKQALNIAYEDACAREMHHSMMMELNHPWIPGKDLK